MNILVVDDHALFRQGLNVLLKSGLALSTSADECATADQACTALSRKHYDLILLDLHLEDTQGIDTFMPVKQCSKTTSLVVLSAVDDTSVVDQCLSLGAKAFINKRSSHQEVLAVVRSVLDWQPTPSQGTASPGLVHAGEPDDSVLANLSKRQREVLQLLLQGEPNKSISSRMDISQNTVKAHLSAIFKILGARNRTEAVYFAARAGLPLK